MASVSPSAAIARREVLRDKKVIYLTEKAMNFSDVYRDLGLQWDPGTCGAVDDLRPGTRVSEVEAAVRKVYGMYARHMGYGSLREQAF